MASGVSLSVREVTVAYGGAPVLDRVSLEVGPGETVAVVGPSGSGKSTLLRAVAGLEPLAGGEVYRGGRSLAGVPVHRRDLGLMFQDHALFPHLDVAGNVAFGLRMKRWPGERQRERVEELLALVGLDGLGGRAVHELSGGEAQRVALARALAPAPALLMLDEPFGSLDRVLREELTAEVRRLLQSLGQTALHVTHDQAEAFALADRVAVLAEGRLVQVGTPAELWHQPASAFVAEFLGHPNRWPAEVAGDGTLSVNGLTLGRVPPDGGGGPAAGGAADSATRWRPGPVSVVVPVDAVRPGGQAELGPRDPSPELASEPGLGGTGDRSGRPGPVLTAQVVEVVFHQGRHRVAARVAGAAPALTVVYESERPVVPGAVVSLTVDLRSLWPLP